MSKKDYILLARVMSQRKPVNTDLTQEEFVARLRQWQATCEKLTEELARENSAFNADKFLAACDYA